MQILNTQSFLCDFRELRNMQNKIGFFFKLLWSKLKFFDLEVPYILKTIKIRTVLTSVQSVCVSRPTRHHLGAYRACLGPVGGALYEF